MLGWLDIWLNWDIELVCRFRIIFLGFGFGCVKDLAGLDIWLGRRFDTWLGFTFGWDGDLVGLG